MPDIDALILQGRTFLNIHEAEPVRRLAAPRYADLILHLGDQSAPSAAGPLHVAEYTKTLPQALKVCEDDDEPEKLRSYGLLFIVASSFENLAITATRSALSPQFKHVSGISVGSAVRGSIDVPATLGRLVAIAENPDVPLTVRCNSIRAFDRVAACAENKFAFPPMRENYEGRFLALAASATERELHSFAVNFGLGDHRQSPRP